MDATQNLNMIQVSLFGINSVKVKGWMTEIEKR